MNYLQTFDSSTTSSVQNLIDYSILIYCIQLYNRGIN